MLLTAQLQPNDIRALPTIDLSTETMEFLPGRVLQLSDYLHSDRSAYIEELGEGCAAVSTDFVSW